MGRNAVNFVVRVYANCDSLGAPVDSRPRYDASNYQHVYQPSHLPAPQQDAYAIIQRQAERIATLEAQLARNEPGPSILDRQSGQNPAVDASNNSFSQFDSHLTSDMEGNRRPPDTVAIGGEDAFVFRGKGFKTQFYGPSSPMSAILNSHMILKFVCTFFPSYFLNAFAIMMILE